MSAWRLVVRELYERGPLRACQVSHPFHANSALKQAADHGMCECDGRGGHSQEWRLTPLGLAYAQGRVALQTLVTLTGGANKSRKYTPRATWLAALPDPQGIRLQSALNGAVVNQNSEGVHAC